ncbi:hypothetical protein PIB30_077427 [Stylosanthes scabra]|uniref:Uncharacterized protein n=1 Tax=Stylosanthes scabra TaxID=79078 RepID=A0ABU6RQZ2_9FABA|nr:hypothetical protein [Stylosanthes scabra]
MEMRIEERILGLVLEEVLRKENQVFGRTSGAKGLRGLNFTSLQNCSRAPGNRFYCNRNRFISERIDSAEARVNSTFETGSKRGLVDSSSSDSILKNVNVRGDERVVLEEVHTVVVRDMYWTGRVGYDNQPGTGSSLENGEACCILLRSRLSGGSSTFHFESSVCNVTISAERVRGAVSHIGVLYLVLEQFFPCEPEEWNCYASEHNLNQGIMQKMSPIWLGMCQ